MPIDEGLNDDMKYIAIDTHTLENATNADKKTVLEYFKKYDVEIMDESFESLKEKGMVKDLNSLDGLLLRIEKVDKISDNEIIIECSKFRSGLGAVGVKCVLKKENNKWIIDSSQMSWIS
ncbi:MAG TPA: hypothetical protein DEF39_00680 [Hungateiclostridium thermocellum]|jgi:hypothetical protein|uniref:Uncharacterized protein n=4 Tax=Acetivibrio thermocellus TaxID=1515 RepID=A3DIJ1_ACET2|nr:hypothetical protein [Acetivibrio thermocellus]ABN53770.1 hypothetical protein Cthe_2569 [Acetivibrio thermocellus ATCC 27405]ADU73251.1 hypothetical protein Clo1313_0155 [Acetivibrio thermocellus DSM 1313]ALX07168.1 hypothetical protein AD2_00157 [Acetivibrio thermocellus AD2]ANV74904.1 hypothetical protein LQRI_0156 [Acetivibrio thermocellus DSM 2360]EIC04366.1 hypothetical protein YSBL_2243 [Acetivibrio thermocellus YS]